MTEALSAELIAEYKDAFSYCDVDGDGVISYTELGQAIRSLGYCPTEQELLDIVSEFGVDYRGQFDFSQFLRLIEKQPKVDVEAQIRAAFKVFDREGTGYISAAYLKHTMTTIGEKLTIEEVDSMLREADVTSDGMINYEDLIQVLLPTKPSSGGATFRRL